MIMSNQSLLHDDYDLSNQLLYVVSNQTAIMVGLVWVAPGIVCFLFTNELLSTRQNILQVLRK